MAHWQGRATGAAHDPEAGGIGIAKQENFDPRRGKIED
jgi:hypothetical protein